MAKLNKAEVEVLINLMEEAYPVAISGLTYEDKFQLLIAVVLSAQTTDVAVNKVTPNLFEKYPNPAALAQGDIHTVEDMLKTIGMYRTKAKHIVALSKILIEDYEGKVPGDYEELIKLPGVGRKTANVVLSVGFGIPRIAVDTHVFRLANRIGITSEKNVLKTELALMDAIPEEKWILMHHAFIWHGRKVCIARNPRCDQCQIEDICKKNGLDK